MARRGKRSDGFTLVETLFAVAIVVTALLATVGSIVTSMRLTRTVNERETATRAMIGKLAQVGATQFDLIVTSFDSDKTNDPGGAGAAPGADFDVDGMKATKNSATGHVGSVVFPLVGGQLREDAVIPELGMPRDLNGDGVIDGADHKNDYQLLPVLVRVDWAGVDGNSNVKICKLLSNK
jgi:type II secretory pathway pseudopilin PulG